MRIIPYTSILFILFFTTIALAQSVSQKALECVTIEADSERLICYDTMANELIQPEVSTSEQWITSIDKNPLDDSKTVILYNQAIEGGTRYRDAPILILRCHSDEISAIIRWDDYLGSDDIQVTYRIGSQESKTDTWYLSSDNKATFYSYNEPANISFIKDLMSADNGSFVAQLTPYNENPVTGVFDISGLSNISNQVFEACE